MSNADERKLMKCVDDFARAMKEKLMKKARDGFFGWDDTDPGGRWRCLDRMRMHAVKNDPDPVDVANFCERRMRNE